MSCHYRWIQAPPLHSTHAPRPPPGFHHAFERWAKPFNPILGETWQAGLSDGSRIFLEQISHHVRAGRPGARQQWAGSLSLSLAGCFAAILAAIGVWGS